MLGVLVAFVVSVVSVADQVKLEGYTISVALPSGFHLKNLKHKVSIERSGQFRNSESIQISIAKRLPTTSNEEKRIGNRVILFKATSVSGGSGGTEFTTTAYEKTGDRFVQFEYRTQSESSEPDLELLWKVVESTHLSK